MTFIRLCYRKGHLKTGLQHVQVGLDILDKAEREVISLISLSDADKVNLTRFDLLHTKASIETDMGDFQSSLKTWLEGKSLFGSVQLTPRKALGGIANSYQGLGNQTEAIEWYRECLKKLDPDRTEISPYEVNIYRSYWAAGQQKITSKGLKITSEELNVTTKELEIEEINIASKGLERLMELRIEKMGPESESIGFHDWM